MLILEHRLFFVGEIFQKLFVPFSVFGSDRQFVIRVVKIFQRLDSVDQTVDRLISTRGDRFWCIVTFTFLNRFLNIRICSVNVQVPHLGDRDIGVIGRIKPAPPEPVEVDAGSVL